MKVVTVDDSENMVYILYIIYIYNIYIYICIYEPRGWGDE